MAEYRYGEYALPPLQAMRADIERERRARKARYVPSARHTMQVDFETYLAELARERRRGAARARRLGNRLPVEVRVHTRVHTLEAMRRQAVGT